MTSNNSNLFSVCMCVYGKDNPDWFKSAIDSVLNQTVKPTEIVLVVDGPVPELLNKYISDFQKNDIFNVIRLKENQGHGNARRIGLENCKCDLVALMDADDVSLPYRFEKQLEAFNKNNDLSIVGGNITEFVNDETNIVGVRKVPQKNAEINEYIKKRCPFNQVTVMFKKDDIQKVGGYKDWYCNEDYYLWIRMYLNNFKFLNIPEILVNVRVGKDMYNRRGGKKYFISEYKLQKYMLKKHVIGYITFLENVTKRFIVQILLPNSLRGIVFQKFARSKSVE